jgi:hypothetical protein
MDQVLTRTGDMPVTHPPQWGTRGVRRPLGHLLLAMAQATAERLISPQRGLPAEWFRFPLP